MESKALPHTTLSGIERGPQCNAMSSVSVSLDLLFLLTNGRKKHTYRSEKGRKTKRRTEGKGKGPRAPRLVFLFFFSFLTPLPYPPILALSYPVTAT